MPDLAARLKAVHSRMEAACASIGRDPAGVCLLGVSKGVTIEMLRQARSLGVAAFGESYLQEALPKIEGLKPRPCWHFIGPIQSNKTRDIATHFDWVHGVDRLKIAERLSAQRPADLAPLSICVQINISNEPSKSGCAPAQAESLCRAISDLSGIRLRGLMAIPAPASPGEDPRAPFAALRRLHAAIRVQLPADGRVSFDTISAGMSDDLEAAIGEGSTIVRIGSALFGARGR